MLLAVNSIAIGLLFGSNFGWAIAIGFAPGVLLFVGLAVRPKNRSLATALIVVSSIAAAVAWWTIYPIVLASVVIIGGFITGKLGFDRSQVVAA